MALARWARAGPRGGWQGGRGGCGPPPHAWQLGCAPSPPPPCSLQHRTRCNLFGVSPSAKQPQRARHAPAALFLSTSTPPPPPHWVGNLAGADTLLCNRVFTSMDTFRQAAVMTAQAGAAAAAWRWINTYELSVARQQAWHAQDMPREGVTDMEISERPPAAAARLCPVPACPRAPSPSCRAHANTQHASPTHTHPAAAPPPPTPPPPPPPPPPCPLQP